MTDHPPCDHKFNIVVWGDNHDAVGVRCSRCLEVKMNTVAAPFAVQGSAQPKPTDSFNALLRRMETAACRLDYQKLVAFVRLIEAPQKPVALSGTGEPPQSCEHAWVIHMIKMPDGYGSPGLATCSKCGASLPPQQVVAAAVAEGAARRWETAALLKDRTRIAIRERHDAGESIESLANDFDVPEAFVSALVAWQMVRDEHGWNHDKYYEPLEIAQIVGIYRDGSWVEESPAGRRRKFWPDGAVGVDLPHATPEGEPPLLDPRVRYHDYIETKRALLALRAAITHKVDRMRAGCVEARKRLEASGTLRAQLELLIEAIEESAYDLAALLVGDVPEGQSGYRYESGKGQETTNPDGSLTLHLEQPHKENP